MGLMITLFLVVLTVCVTYYNIQANRDYINGGYEKRTVPGCEYTVWQKVVSTNNTGVIK